MADGSTYTHGTKGTDTERGGIAATAAEAKAAKAAKAAKIDALCDQAVAEQAAALAAMSDAEKLALCDAAVAKAWEVVGCHRDADAAAVARADLPGIIWAALTDLVWTRQRAKKRLDAGCEQAGISLDANTLARVALNCLDSQDDFEERQGRNSKGTWCGTETAAGWGWGDADDAPEHVIVERATPDLELEAEETLASRFAIAFLLAPLLAPVQRGAS